MAGNFKAKLPMFPSGTNLGAVLDKTVQPEMDCNPVFTIYIQL